MAVAKLQGDDVPRSVERISRTRVSTFEQGGSKEDSRVLIVDEMVHEDNGCIGFSMGDRSCKGCGLVTFRHESKSETGVEEAV